MKDRTGVNIRFQGGASIFATMIIMAFIGIFLLTGLKIAPTYLDNNVIVNAMEGVIANNDIKEMSVAQIREEVMRTVVVNGIRDFDPANIVVTREGSLDYVDINYEARVPLFYNIEAVVIFENRFDK